MTDGTRLQGGEFKRDRLTPEPMVSSSPTPNAARALLALSFSFTLLQSHDCHCCSSNVSLSFQRTSSPAIPPAWNFPASELCMASYITSTKKFAILSKLVPLLLCHVTPLNCTSFFKVLNQQEGRRKKFEKSRVEGVLGGSYNRS